MTQLLFFDLKSVLIAGMAKLKLCVKFAGQSFIHYSVDKQYADI